MLIHIENIQSVVSENFNLKNNNFNIPIASHNIGKSVIPKAIALITLGTFLEFDAYKSIVRHGATDANVSIDFEDNERKLKVHINSKGMMTYKIYDFANDKWYTFVDKSMPSEVSNYLGWFIAKEERYVSVLHDSLISGIPYIETSKAYASASIEDLLQNPEIENKLANLKTGVESASSAIRDVTNELNLYNRNIAGKSLINTSILENVLMDADTLINKMSVVSPLLDLLEELYKTETELHENKTKIKDIKYDLNGLLAIQKMQSVALELSSLPKIPEETERLAEITELVLLATNSTLKLSELPEIDLAKEAMYTSLPKLLNMVTKLHELTGLIDLSKKSNVLSNINLIITMIVKNRSLYYNIRQYATLELQRKQISEELTILKNVKSSLINLNSSVAKLVPLYNEARRYREKISVLEKEISDIVTNNPNLDICLNCGFVKEVNK